MLRRLLPRASTRRRNRLIAGTAFTLLTIAASVLIGRRLTHSSWPLDHAQPLLVVAAALLYRARQPVPAMLACALTGLLVSPLSWDHHWVWVAPGIALLAHLGASAPRKARGRVRAAWWVAAACLFLIFASWPQFWNLGQSGLTPAGLGWYAPGTYFATGSKPWYHEFHWHGLQLLAGNSAVLTGLACLAALVVAAVLCRTRERPRELGP